jgi:adenylate kinase family enzyme
MSTVGGCTDASRLRGRGSRLRKDDTRSALAASLGVPFVELDSIFHQPGWVELPVDDFRKRVTEALTAPAWVVDGNYSAVRDLVWQRVDTVVWLDLPRRRVMYRIILRTVAARSLANVCGTATVSRCQISTGWTPRRTSSGGHGSSTPTTSSDTTRPCRTRCIPT